MKLGTIIALVGLWLVLGVQPAQAQAAANQVGLIIMHGDGSVVTRCVDFSEPQINGYDVLQRSGLDLNIEVAGMGAAICRIDNEGCTYPQQACFCQTEGETSTYWSYWRLGESGWQYSNLGASNAQITPGSLEGWVWGAGTVNSTNPPPALTFAEVCALATATPSATPTVTLTPTLTPTPTATMTETPAPSPTPTTMPATETPTAAPTLTPLPTQALFPSATWTPIPTATPAPPRIELFAVDRSTLETGQSVRISWIARDTAGVQLQGNGADLALGPVGSLDVQPLQTTTYVLVAHNPGGEVRATLVVTVVPAVPTPTPLLVVVTDSAPTITSVALAIAPSTATLVPTATLLPTATPLPIPSATAVPTQVVTAEATATATVLVLTDSVTGALAASVVFATIVWPTATPDPARAQMQLLMLFGGVGLVLLIPMGIFAVVALLWVLRRSA